MNPLLGYLSNRLPIRYRRSLGSLRTQLIIGNVLALTLLLGGLAVVCRAITHKFIEGSVDRELERNVARYTRRGPARPGRGPSPMERIGFGGGPGRPGRGPGGPGEMHGGPDGGPGHGRFHVPPGDDAFSPQLYYPDGVAESPSVLHKILSKRDFARATKGEKVWDTITVDDSPARVFYMPAFDHDNKPGIAQVAYDLTEVDRTLSGMDTAFVLLLPFGLLGAWGVGILLTNRVLRRMQQMTQAAGHLGSVDFTRRLPVAGYDEFAELAGTFNGLLGRLDTAYQAQQRLLEAQRHFTADASHELKTPLTIIKGRAGLAISRESTDERSRRTFCEIDSAVDTMSQLVQDLLLLSRADEGQMGGDRIEMQVSEVLHSAIDQATLPDSAPITLTVVPPDLSVTGNESELARLFRNLLDNAIRYTPADGSITLTARTDLHTDPPNIVITVQDTGQGMAPEHLAHIGERFYRADASRTRPTGGTGLGISICKGIVEAHGGTIGFESALGVGTTVTVTLPVPNENEVRAV
ncbi:MAG: sensor histidine kinase [Chthonomonadales bacterium]|nr:sensor histidine kinase [Chthonomonadales bacterium]